MPCFAPHYFNKAGLKNYYFLLFVARWNIYSLINGVLLYLEDVSVGGEELAKGLKPIRKGKIFWIKNIIFFSMSALCQIAFCADMKSYLVQYEQQRHWTGQVVNIHPTSYWSSCREGLVNLIPIHTSEFCFRVRGFQSSLLVILFRCSLNTCSHCDEEWQKWIRYVTNSFITWTEAADGCVRDRLIYCFTHFSGQFSQKYISILVNRSFLAKDYFQHSIILIQK